MNHKEIKFSISRVNSSPILYIQYNMPCISIGKMADLTQEYVMHGKEKNITKVVIDLGTSSCTSTSYEKYQFAHQTAKERGLDRKWKIALIRDKKNKAIDFLETAMYCAGYSFQLFTDKDEAFRWIEDELTPTPNEERKKKCAETAFKILN